MKFLNIELVVVKDVFGDSFRGKAEKASSPLLLVLGPVVFIHTWRLT